MSRILLTWELGLNLGHLTRLLPVAQQLKADGHAVLVATRDIQAAATVLAPAGIAFVQAPHLPQGIALKARASGYADILLSQGWSDRSVLHGLTHAWLNLFRLFNPERLILDYSPTVSLAARIARLATVLVGNGFELPPATDPLPPFPGFSWATPARAAESEGVAVANANAVLRGFGATPITALRDLSSGQRRLLATFPELDHYGERADEQYIGPLLGDIKAPRVEWPEGKGPRIFASLRPDTSHVELILAVLAETKARVVCVARGFTAAQLEGFRKDRIRYVPGPVDLHPLDDADLCISYGAEGTMLKFLLAGVPQLVSPWHVETFMSARRVEALQAGRILKESQAVDGLASYFAQLCADPGLKAQAIRFAQRHAEYSCEEAVAAITRAINTPQEQMKCRCSSPAPGTPNGCEKIDHFMTFKNPGVVLHRDRTTSDGCKRDLSYLGDLYEGRIDEWCKKNLYPADARRPEQRASFPGIQRVSPVPPELAGRIPAARQGETPLFWIPASSGPIAVSRDLRFLAVQSQSTLSVWRLE